ncbi:beta-lactamase-like protein [Mycolicibacterium insubricum]|jgi:glyoxylase-like metal-dependent hydrolase (beta-lactamase superfamily II)|uniref:MBL fold metallo-hydrolase n=1 Tax=Mycolicibacterium insubricum TaxID=444597 RepID=A0A1X0DG22_9MYCO|nr:MBL fold metallo-hydrolase [Mycolicibacterium insubricum]MCV7080177.1 MBL fold metallo-hydrolase [Mycolicibacterium insubricum]ORA71325.1 MBL fold metallo-hydrolase [Mycolicibacterium insubricum]BBZ68068.1 beta-lactamase-like protein [Mycolicibacterium insubricum]
MKIDQVSDSVYAVAGTNVNWALVTSDAGVTLIDAGYYGDTADLLKSLGEIGHDPADVAAVLITHAHLDHIGAIPTLVEKVGMPVYTGAAEVPHARREYLEQITPKEMLQQLTYSAGRRWVAQTMIAVRGRMDLKVPSAVSADDVDLPGRLTTIATPGHTTGHTAYFLESEGVLFSGDALVTGHPLSPCSGPQILPAFFNQDEARTRDSARLLENHPARTIVPGHGPSIQVNRESA